MPRDSKAMPFLAHLEELRWRIIKCLASILVGSVVIYFFSDQMLDFLTRPVRAVYFSGVTEAFAVRIKLSLYGGLILSVPVILYQAWQFVVPGLLEREVKVALPVVVAATLFFAGGGAFCFFVVLPAGIKFLLTFGSAKLQPLITVDKYVSFVSFMVIAFGAVFELPVLAFVLGQLGIISHRTLAKGRRYAVVLIVILAAILTPTPDAFSQLMLAVPLYFLYELSILVVRLTGRRKLGNTVRVLTPN